MTLEPVHIKEIHDLVSRIDSCLRNDESDDDDTDSVKDILKLLGELRYEGKTVLKAIGKVKRGKASIERMIGSEDPFGISYACDSGSTTARTFDNGLYVDFCHCALASSPTDLEIHNMRTIVAATYTASRKVTIDTSSNWELFDSGAGRKKIIRIQPGILNKKTNDMLHDIALYLCESEHLLWMLEKMQDESFLIMDGPIYPKRLMYWMVVASDDIQIRTDPHSEKVLQNYIDIMDHHIGTQKPLVGFVKNPEDMQIMQILKKKESDLDLPWMLDAQFFKNALSPEKAGIKSKDARKYITYTNWFLQPNQFYEKMINTTSPLVRDKLSHKFPAEDYSLAFFMVLVPSMNTIFKIESPYGLVKNEDMRKLITRKVLYDIALNGIPKTLSKADSVAKIQLSERRQIIDRFKNSRIDTNYNDIRWGEMDER
ncbi:DNA double-strand break repair nuclease NurA [Methanolobus sp. ZRKC2]|uniref:DNA double-strand break repair nuclease NurA n=1 Tax=Methanolobus sp. ZRKC2 TaxID=3125783 RepID=UPI0032479637